MKPLSHVLAAAVQPMAAKGHVALRIRAWRAKPMPLLCSALCGLLCLLQPLSAQVTAVDDLYFATEGFSAGLLVLNNDTPSIALDTMSLEVVGDPGFGTAVPDPILGRVIYTPTGDFNGFDNFRYAVGDGINPPDTAEVTVLVYPVNDPPVILNDVDSLLNTSSAFLYVLDNDSDPIDPLGNINPFTLSIVTPPLHGSASPTGGALGRVLYNPVPGFSGIDSFEYRVCDDGNPLPSICNTAWVYVHVFDPVTAGPDQSVCIGDSVQLTASGPGPYTWSPAAGLSCTDCPSPWASPAANTTYTVTATIGACCSSSDNLSVTVQFPGSATANDDAVALNEDGSAGFNALSNDVPSDSFDLVLESSTSNGSLIFNPDGTGTYTPDPDFSGSDTAIYRICPRGCPAPCDTARILFSINPVNDPPLVLNDTFSTDEDLALAVQPLLNDIDTDAAFGGGMDSASIVILGGPLHGSAAIDPATGTITYTPDPDYNGPDSLRYRACDLGSPPPAACGEATIYINVLPVPDPPVAVADLGSVLEDDSVDLDVLANDFDADGSLGSVTVVLGNAPVHGSASVNPDGSIAYIPSPDYFGPDSLSYIVCDGALPPACDSAWVRIDVLPVNDAPIALNDVALTDEDTPVSHDVLANDSDIDGSPDPGTVAIVAAPANGSAVVNPDGSIAYAPDPDFFGTDSLRYAVCDDGFPLPPACDTATLIVLVSPVNDPIAAVNDADTVLEDSSADMDVLSNDLDIDGFPDPASVVLLSPPANGSATVDPATGLIAYSPDPNYFGTDLIRYRVCDNGVPPSCDSAELAIVVLPVNDAPTALNDTLGTTEEVAVNANVLANDSDIDGSPVPGSVAVLTPPANGSASVNPDGSIAYTPDLDFSGLDSLAYTVCDDGTPLPAACDTAWVFVAVAPVNDAPIAMDDSAVLLEDETTTVDVLTNDSDADGTVLPSGLSLLSSPAHGGLTLNPDGTITYTPDANYFGLDSFQYQLCDGAAPPACDSAWVLLDVQPVNDPPVALNDNAATPEDVPVNLDLDANDSDVDGTPQPSSIALLTPPANGSVVLDPATGVVTYTPDLDFSGIDSFRYSICDDGFPLPAECDTAWAFVAVAAFNDSMNAADDAAVVLEDTPADLDILGNDSDPDGSPDPGSVLLLSGPFAGTAGINPDGSLAYSPNPDFFGLDSVHYAVCDDGIPPTCDSAWLRIEVQPVNDPPLAVDDVALGIEDSLSTIDVLANDSDVDGTPISVSIPAGPGFAPSNGSATVNPDGSIAYTPNPDFFGTDSLRYVVCDDGFPLPAECDTALVIILVSPVNDAPIAVDDALNLLEDSSLAFSPLDNDIDAESLLDSAGLSILTPPANGSLSWDPLALSALYIPTPDYFGLDSALYRICDGGLIPACDSAWIVFTVEPVNDPILAVDDAVATLEEVPTAFLPLDNDLDIDGIPDPASLSIVLPPSGGLALADPGTGGIGYLPNPGFIGLDSLSYRVCDDGTPLPPTCDTGWVFITVSEIVNIPPAAGDDALLIDEDESGTVALLANDNDPDGALDTASLAIAASPLHGSASFLPGTDSLLYTPSANYYGLDSLAYTVCDTDFAGGLAVACDTAWVLIVINPVNDAPIAANDGVATGIDTAVAIAILANDSDIDGNIDSSSLSLIAPPASGSLSYDPSTGLVTYTPDPSFTGIDTFQYAICDDGFPLPSACDTAFVLVAVGTGSLPNGAVFAGGDTLHVLEDSSGMVDVLANDSDVEANLDTAGMVVLSGPFFGTASLDSGWLSYAPNPDYYGLDSLSYRICDLDIPTQCDTGWIQVIVEPINDAPVAINDLGSSTFGDSIVLSVLDNDTDIDGNLDTSSLFILTPPANGTASVDLATGLLTYIPDAGFSGLDSAQYRICDDGFPLPAECDSAWVVFNVVLDPPGNDAPTALDDAFVVFEDSLHFLDILANDHDPENTLDTAATLLLSPPANGTASWDAAAQRMRYQGNLHYNGPDSFRYVLFDLGEPLGLDILSDTAWVLLEVLPVADAPIALDDANAGSMDDALAWNPLNNDSDPDEDLDSASVMLLFPPMNGSLEGSANAWTYQPDSGWCGTDSFEYQVCDTSGLCASAWVFMTVACDSFYAIDDTASTGLETPVVIAVLDNDDPRADAACLSLSVDPLHGEAQVLQGGEIEYQPDAGFYGLDTLQYRICDSSGTRSATASLVVRVIYDRVKVPEGFSPNGDGINDTWQILGLAEIPNHELVIVNRWGKELLRAAPYGNDWDGRFKGRDLPAGTYFFILQTDRDIPDARVTGPITIRR